MKPDKEDLTYIKELIEAGKVIPVIDKSYSLSELPEAFQYYAEGRSRGKVVVTVAH
jgi:NADPH:quinone reductase-like Zn-dependent oxidoreductase